MAKKLATYKDYILDANGAPISGAQIFTYDAGSSTKRATYTDAAGGTEHDNPIVVDADGRVPPIWLDEAVEYKILAAPAADIDPPDSPLADMTYDNVVGVTDNSGTQSQWLSTGLTPTRLSGTQFTVSGDQTSTFQVNRRLQIVDSGGTKVGIITASSYSAPNTTVTATIDASGTIATGLSSVSVGIITPDSTSTVVINDDTLAAESDTLPPAQGSVKAYVDAAVAAEGPFLKGFISGLVWSNGTDTVNDIDISAGKCRSAADDANFTGTAQTKQMDATWATGTNAGAITATAWGATGWAAATTYHIFAATIAGVAEYIVDTSVTGTNITTDHSPTALRRIGSFLSGATPNVPLGGTNEIAGGGVQFSLDVPVSDYNGTGSSSAITQALSIPSDVVFESILGLYQSNASTLYSITTALNQADTNPTTSFDMLTASGGARGTMHKRVMTNTSAQIRHRVSTPTGTTFQVRTWGYIDERLA